MNARAPRVSGGLAAAALVAGLAACSAGSLSVLNESDTDVVVSTGDEEFDAPGWGGAALLDYGCSPGDVTVEFATGEEVVVRGPVCPDEEIVISADGDVELRPTSDGGRGAPPGG
ncbi:hypothetical protein [Cellulosimicrobium marinum]|uniref:hypothetical protein n=1 Tax=Cellulosimicrobium marinum TaxID=1638992 RepID=UPI001E4E1D6C|nr:hypothetical protein [Cellulosimicrobium marinum]MCB7135541.1 hypothetical protein [Cellulosimicrobium marinum]